MKLRLPLIFVTIAAACSAQVNPEIYLSVRGAANRTIAASEPLFVAVRIEAPESAPLRLSPGLPSWTDAVAVELAGPGGTVRARASRAGLPELTVTPDEAAGELWYFPGEATARLTPGTYQLRARLEVAGGAGWKGAASTDGVSIRIQAPSSTSDPLQRAVAAATEQLLLNRPEDAVKILDPLLTTHPNHDRLLAARAQACAMGGDWASAALCIERGLAKAESSGYPPIQLTRMQEEIWQAQVNGAFAASSPAAWTRLPETVLVRDWQKVPDYIKTRAASTASQALSGAGGDAGTSSTRATSGGSPASLSPAGGDPPGTRTVGAASPGVVVPPSEIDDNRAAGDPAGQWAATATAGTEYARTQYSAGRATCAPNVPKAGNSADAWCSAKRSGGLDWLEVGFARPVQAREVRIRQNDTPGTIAKVEAIEPGGTTHVWWEGKDPNPTPAVRQIVWFAVRVPQTSYLVARIRVTINLDAAPGYKQIDAVQLVE